MTNAIRTARTARTAFEAFLARRAVALRTVAREDARLEKVEDYVIDRAIDDLRRRLGGSRLEAAWDLKRLTDDELRNLLGGDLWW